MEKIVKKFSSLLFSALLAFTAAFAVMPAATAKAGNSGNGGGKAATKADVTAPTIDTNSFAINWVDSSDSSYGIKCSVNVAENGTGLEEVKVYYSVENDDINFYDDDIEIIYSKTYSNGTYKDGVATSEHFSVPSIFLLGGKIKVKGIYAEDSAGNGAYQPMNYTFSYSKANIAKSDIKVSDYGAYQDSNVVYSKASSNDVTGDNYRLNNYRLGFKYSGENNGSFAGLATVNGKKRLLTFTDDYNDGIYVYRLSFSYIIGKTYNVELKNLYLITTTESDGKKHYFYQEVGFDPATVNFTCQSDGSSSSSGQSSSSSSSVATEETSAAPVVDPATIPSDLTIGTTPTQAEISGANQVSTVVVQPTAISDGGIKHNDEYVAKDIANVQAAVEKQNAKKTKASKKKATSVTIDMLDGAAVPANLVPAEVLETVKGQNVNVTFDMGSYSWTVNGNDLANTNIRDINIGLSSEPAAIPESTVSAIAKKNPYSTISIKHIGEFGFKARLTINVGKKYKGKYANFYTVNDAGQALSGYAKVNRKGNVTVDFNHGGDYVITFTKRHAKN